MRDNLQKHCLNVLKVYDWVSVPTDLMLSHSFEHKKRVKDEICGLIELHSGDNALLWEVTGNLSVSGEVTVFHEMGNTSMEVFVNKQPVFTVQKGEVRTINVQRLSSLEVRCKGNGNDLCIGKYCLTICYPVKQSCFSPGDCKLICFLSDEKGKPVDSLECREITQTKGRPDVPVTLPNGEKALLQKVKVLKKGFITVQLKNKNKVCKICTIPFKVVEELILCAPLGTFLQCKVTDFECKAYFSNDCKKINIEIFFCQQIQMVANVNIEVETILCHPRFEREIHPCLVNPPPIACKQ
ncbi:DUF3992 domain-containing protein [Gracilibacillus sp. HCP3S3_G5_1]|uniref:DUF3992 domain-containing protein n=1 Tax=unclassified Gracilibacillus TaxID=2625209 RepID=UPI003F888791